MSDLNSFSCTARLTKDALQKTLPTGTELTEFDVAVNTGFGEHQDTMFLSCTMWGKQGKTVCPYLKKGGEVALTGSIALQKWIGKADGAEHMKLVLNVRDLVLKGSKPKDSTVQADTVHVKDDEEIPF